jgi:hypothetical protein
LKTAESTTEHAGLFRHGLHFIHQFLDLLTALPQSVHLLSDFIPHTRPPSSARAITLLRLLPSACIFLLQPRCCLSNAAVLLGWGLLSLSAILVPIVLE